MSAREKAEIAFSEHMDEWHAAIGFDTSELSASTQYAPTEGEDGQ